MAKPFHLPELTARMRAVMRRRGGRREGPVRVGELVVDPLRREVTVGGRPVTLANKEFTLLHALAAEPTRVFTTTSFGPRGRDVLTRGRRSADDNLAAKRRPGPVGR
jgi:two-component system, OmpR family, response regulator